MPTSSAILTFELGGQCYGLPRRAIWEIVPMAELYRPMSLPAAVAGFLNLGGIAIPVLHLARLVRIPEFPIELYTPLIVLRGSGLRLALMVERVDRIVTVETASIVAIPPTNTLNDCVDGSIVLGDRVVFILNPDRLLLEKEGLCVAELQAHEQARLGELGGATS